MTHICVGKLTTIGSDNGLSPDRRQAIIWTNARLLLIGPLGTNFSEILIGIQTFSFKKMHLKMSSAKWRPLCLGLNVLISGVRGLGIDLANYVWCLTQVLLSKPKWWLIQIWIVVDANDNCRRMVAADGVLPIQSLNECYRCTYICVI